MKPTVQAGRKKRNAAQKGSGRRRGGGALPAIGRSPQQAQQGRLSLPGHTRTTPRKAGGARHVKTSPELSTHLPELEHHMVDAVQSSSDAIAELRKSMGVAAPAVPGRAGRRPPRHRPVGTHGPSSSHSPPRHGSDGGGAGGGGGGGDDLREAYEVLLERTEVLADELEELREQERRQKIAGSTVAAHAPGSAAEGGELERLRSLIAGLEQGVQTSSAQLESLRGRFDEEVQAKATEVEAAVRKAEQKRVEELERALKVSSSTNATMESALADMKKQGSKQEKQRRIQSEYGETEVTDELEDATVPSVAAGDVTVGEVDQLRLAWSKAFERRSAVALVKLFAPNGRLQGSLSTIVKRDAPSAAPLSGASSIEEYFHGFFQRFPLVKVQGAGMLQPVVREGVQPIAEGTAVWSTAAELQLYDHPQDVTFKTASVSFVFTLRRLSSDQGDAVQILSQHCVVTALVRGPSDESKLSARSGGSGKHSARDAGSEAEPLSAQQLLEQRAARQAAQKQRRDQIAAKRQQQAIEEEEARRAQEDADRKAAAAARKRAQKKRQMNAAGHAATSAPKRGTYAVKGSKKMEKRLAEVEVTAVSGASSQPKISPRKPQKKTPRSSKGETREGSVAAKKSPRKERQEQYKLAEDAAARVAREEQELNGAASKLQARQRGRVARRRVAVQKNEMHGAASMLQARQRGRIARKNVAQQRTEINGAASMLQARQRGHVARKHVAQQRTEMNGAASKLQARARGRLVRKELAQKKAEAAVAAAQQAAAVAAAAVAEAKEGETGAEDEEAYSDDDYEDDFSDDFEDETESGFQTETPDPASDADHADAAGWTARDHAAAAVVQARQRGRATRRHVATRRAQARADRLEQEGAARRIQARHRGKLARNEAARRKEARGTASAQQGAQDNLADEHEYEQDDAYEEDYDDDFSDFESQGAPTPVPARAHKDDDDDELEAAARRIQARQRGKLARHEMREQHRAAAKMQAVHRGRAARQRQAAKQRKAAAAVEAAREASLLAAALVDAAQNEGQGDDEYGDEGFDDDFEDDDASLDVDDLWQQMEDVGEPAPAPAPAPAPTKTVSALADPTSPEPAPFAGEEFGELTAMPAIRAIAAGTGQEFLSPTPSMREDIPSLSIGLGTPSAAPPAPQPAALHAPSAARSSPLKEEVAGTAANDDADENYSDFDDDEFGSLDADDIWDQPVMKADPLVPA
jgi:hypothetical protein